jgi:hypothetical protein
VVAVVVEMIILLLELVAVQALEVLDYLIQ